MEQSNNFIPGTIAEETENELGQFERSSEGSYGNQGEADPSASMAQLE